MLTQRRLGPACLNAVFSIPSSNGVSTLPGVYRKGALIPVTTEVLPYSLQPPAPQTPRYPAVGLVPGACVCGVQTTCSAHPPSQGASQTGPGKCGHSWHPSPPAPRACHTLTPPHPHLMPHWLERGKKGRRKGAGKELREACWGLERRRGSWPPG